jgi:hypothetical protein
MALNDLMFGKEESDEEEYNEDEQEEEYAVDGPKIPIQMIVY